jgi:protein TonB
MSNSISEFVNRNFNTKLGKELGLKGRQKIDVIFKIDNQGNIAGVRSRASHPALEEEAIRVVTSLPKMKPGKQKGRAVTVPYSLPIIFVVNDNKTNSDKPKN